MLKKCFSLAAMILCFFAAIAQNPQPLPLNSKVRSGKLPNGLSYYILHNEEPKERANFYIAQKVGSTLENQNQLGLAHFLEHMAFNGTAHYPGKSMLEYLQSKGLRFGADINAQTGFDETIYNINGVPTTDKALMDSVLLVLRDWSDAILLEEKEIEAERGVIQEEWRGSENAYIRMARQMLKKVYKEYQYQQLPIGDINVVMNFKPEDLRSYYKKWYRPDQQGIVIVGDFDAAEMEAKVKSLFADVKMPENAAPREYAAVSDNDEPIFFAFQDPEQQVSMVEIYFKHNPMPREIRNTDQGVLGDLMKKMIALMINERINEERRKPESAFAAAGVVYGNYLVSKTKGAFTIRLIAKSDIEKAVAQVMAIVARACKTGFNASEWERACQEMESRAQKVYNERDKTSNSALASELIDHFVDNDPMPDPELKLMIAKAPAQIPVSVVNQVAASSLNPKNEVIVVTQRQTPDSVLPEESAIVGAVNNAIAADYEPYQEEKITEPLLPSEPKEGSIVSESTDEKTGTIRMKLSNGVNVVVKPTDFQADQVYMKAIRKAGKNTIPAGLLPEQKLFSNAVNVSKLGNFDKPTLNKYLAGKQVSTSLNLSSNTTSLLGSSTVKDLPTLMEMIHADFTTILPDEKAYKAEVDNQLMSLANAAKNSDKVFAKHVLSARYGNNPAVVPVDSSDVMNADYARILDIVKDITSNAADFNFYFVGNIDLGTLRPLIAKYIASLPSKGKADLPAEINPIKQVNNNLEDRFQQPMHTPSIQIYDMRIGEMPATLVNSLMMQFAGNVLSNIFTETLREEEGGSYSPGAVGMLSPDTKEFTLLGAYQTGAEKQQRMEARAEEEINKLLNEGASEAHFSKVKEAAIKQFEINRKKNNYWITNLPLYDDGIDFITEAETTLKGITLKDFNEFLKQLSKKANRVKVVMEGVEEK